MFRYLIVHIALSIQWDICLVFGSVLVLVNPNHSVMTSSTFGGGNVIGSQTQVEHIRLSRRTFHPIDTVKATLPAFGSVLVNPNNSPLNSPTFGLGNVMRSPIQVENKPPSRRFHRTVDTVGYLFSL